MKSATDTVCKFESALGEWDGEDATPIIKHLRGTSEMLAAGGFHRQKEAAKRKAEAEKKAQQEERKAYANALREFADQIESGKDTSHIVYRAFYVDEPADYGFYAAPTPRFTGSAVLITTLLSVGVEFQKMCDSLQRSTRR